MSAYVSADLGLSTFVSCTSTAYKTSKLTYNSDIDTLVLKHRWESPTHFTGILVMNQFTFIKLFKLPIFYFLIPVLETPY